MRPCEHDRARPTCDACGSSTSSSRESASSVPDADAGAYVDALDPKEYIVRPGPKLRRYRVNTRASFEIERATSSDRMERFVEALFSHGAQRSDAVWWTENDFVEVADVIIDDPRFAPTGYRQHEVRVAEQRVLAARERVHFVGARHVDVPSLMEGLIESWRAHHLVELPKPVPGAIAGPNGEALRLSRIVRRSVRGLRRRWLPQLRIRLHPPAQRRKRPSASPDVHNDTADLYRYPDLTAQVEALCKWFEAAVNTELVEELHTLRAFDGAREAMRAVVELPDQRENLFIRICLQSSAAGNGYKLSNAKRPLFAELTSDEIEALESAVREAFQSS